MNTCKAALRILHARKLYVIIYLVWIGAMMLGISWHVISLIIILYLESVNNR